MVVFLDQDIGKTFKGYWLLSYRVLFLKTAGKPLDLDIIQIYSPTSTSSDEDRKSIASKGALQIAGFS